MFDLNKIPAVEEEMVQDVGTEQRSYVPNGTQRYRTGAENSVGPWQTLSPSELASLYNMVHVPANYQRVHHVITHRANGSSEHTWISWHPAHHIVSPGGLNAAEWRTMPSYFATAPPLAAGRTASVITSNPFFKHGRLMELWTKAGGHPPLEDQMCQSTTDLAGMADYHGVSDEQSDSSYGEIFDHRKSMRRNKSNVEGRSAVRLVELESSSDCTKQGTPHKSTTYEDGADQAQRAILEAPTPVRSAQNRQRLPAPKSHEHIGSSKQGASLRDRTTPCMSSADLNGAENLDHLASEKRKREIAFNAAFNFDTQRCTPTSPCSGCLEFCKTPLPVSLVETGCLGALYVDDDRPPVLKNIDDDEAAQKRGARHGPKSKSSEYRGVTFYKRTGRWEAHIWHEAAQVYLGASATKEEAARAYDKAALLLSGPDVDINFKPEGYQQEMTYLYKLSKEQLVIYLRRDSRGYGAQATYPGVKHVKNHYQASYGAILLGTFPTEEEAARAVYKAAVQDSFGTMASLIIDTHHVRNMPSFAAQRFAALYPEALDTMIQNNQTKASASKKGSKSSTSTKKCSSRSTKQKPSSSPTANATASPDPVEQLPAIQINEEVPRAAQRNRRTWGQHLASKHGRGPKQAWPTNLSPPSDGVAARNPPATVVPPSSSRRAFNTTPGVRVRISPSASVHSAFSGTGQTSSAQEIPSAPGSVSSPRKKRPADTSAPGPIKFKLFNVEINVAEAELAAPGHGGHGNFSPRAQALNGEGDLYTPPMVTEDNQFDKLALPKKRCKITGEWCPYIPYGLATQMTSGLNDVVSINKRLHEILAETVPPRYATPQGPASRPPVVRTGLTLEQPETRNSRFPNRYNKYRKPTCACHTVP